MSVKSIITNKKVFLRDNYICIYCGLEMGIEFFLWQQGFITREQVPITVDHIIPRAKGGKSAPNNLATSCKKCNEQKAAKIWVNKKTIAILNMPKYCTRHKEEHTTKICSKCDAENKNLVSNLMHALDVPYSIQGFTDAKRVLEQFLLNRYGR